MSSLPARVDKLCLCRRIEMLFTAHESLLQVVVHVIKAQILELLEAFCIAFNVR